MSFKLVDSSNPDASDDEIKDKWAQWYSSFLPSPSGSGDEDPISQGIADGGSDYDDDEDDEDGTPTPDEETSGGRAPKKVYDQKPKAAKKQKKNAHTYELNHGSDVVGVLFLEISSITDLPPEKNGTLLVTRIAIFRY